MRKADKVLPVYCFDPFYFTKSASGEPKTGNFRARFLLQSVADLRKNLQSIASETHHPHRRPGKNFTAAR